MKNVRINWLTLPSGLVLGADFSAAGPLDPAALRNEQGACVRVSTLAQSDRASVYDRFSEELTERYALAGEEVA